MKIIIKYDELYGELLNAETNNILFAKLKIQNKFFIINKDSEKNENKEGSDYDVLEVFEISNAGEYNKKECTNVSSKKICKNIKIDFEEYFTNLTHDNFNADQNNNNPETKIIKATQIKLNNINIIKIDNSDNSLIIDCNTLNEKNSVLVNTNRVYIPIPLKVNGKIVTQFVDEKNTVIEFPLKNTKVKINTPEDIAKQTSIWTIKDKDDTIIIINGIIKKEQKTIPIKGTDKTEIKEFFTDEKNQIIKFPLTNQKIINTLAELTKENFLTPLKDFKDKNDQVITGNITEKQVSKTGKFEYQGDSTIFLSNIVNNNQQKELWISKDETTKITFDEINLIEQEEIDEAAQIVNELDGIL